MFTVVVLLFTTAPSACSTFSAAGDDTDGGPDGALDAASGPADLRLHCGDARCTPRTEVCCGIGVGNPAICRDPNGCPSTIGRSYACTEASNCGAYGSAGAVFCCLVVKNGASTGSHCSADPGCEGTDHDLLCLDGDGYGCPSGGSCVATDAYPNDLPVAYHCAGYPRVGP